MSELKSPEEITKERGSAYGPFIENCKSCVAVVKAATGETISTRAAAWCMIGHKIGRAKFSPKKDDHYVDIGGYAKLIYDMEKQGMFEE